MSEKRLSLREARLAGLKPVPPRVRKLAALRRLSPAQERWAKFVNSKGGRLL